MFRLHSGPYTQNNSVQSVIKRAQEGVPRQACKCVLRSIRLARPFLSSNSIHAEALLKLVSLLQLMCIPPDLLLHQGGVGELPKPPPQLLVGRRAHVAADQQLLLQHVVHAGLIDQALQLGPAVNKRLPRGHCASEEIHATNDVGVTRCHHCRKAK